MGRTKEKEILVAIQSFLSFTSERIPEIHDDDDDIEIQLKDISCKQISLQDYRNRLQNKKNLLQLQHK